MILFHFLLLIIYEAFSLLAILFPIFFEFFCVEPFHVLIHFTPVVCVKLASLLEIVPAVRFVGFFAIFSKFLPSFLLGFIKFSLTVEIIIFFLKLTG